MNIKKEPMDAQQTPPTNNNHQNNHHIQPPPTNHQPSNHNNQSQHNNTITSPQPAATNSTTNNNNALTAQQAQTITLSPQVIVPVTMTISPNSGQGMVTSQQLSPAAAQQALQQQQVGALSRCIREIYIY